MVFQSYALFPHMTAAENIGFGLLSWVSAARRSIDASAKWRRRCRSRTAGEKPTGVVGRPKAARRHRARDHPQSENFLFDEPLSNLDAALRVQMRLELTRLHARLGATMIYVTHDQIEAMTLADRIVVFNGGRIEQVGAPMQLYERPANLFVARFIGAPR